jgi:hypothetical protein
MHWFDLLVKQYHLSVAKSYFFERFIFPPGFKINKQPLTEGCQRLRCMDIMQQAHFSGLIPRAMI